MGVEGMSTTVQATIVVRHAAGGWTEQKGIPAGPQPDLVSVPIPAGVYSVEATLPSGLSLCLDGEISPGETQSVVLAGEDAMSESLDWSSFALSGAVSILKKAKRTFKEKVVPQIEEAWEEHVIPKVTETLSREGAKVYERYQLPIRERFSMMKNAESDWASSYALESLGTAPTMGHASSVELPEDVGSEPSFWEKVKMTENVVVPSPPASSAVSGVFMRFWRKQDDRNWEQVGANAAVILPAEQGVVQLPVLVDPQLITKGLMFLVEVGGFSSGISEFCMLPRKWRDGMERTVPATLVLDTFTESRRETSLSIRVRATVQDPDLAQLMSAMKTADHQAVDHVVARLADEYLHEKVRNPLMAAAAALALLKMRQLELLRDWTYNLASWFPELPDGPVIRAWHLLFGAPSKDARDTAREWLLESVRRGQPLFFESLRLLVNGLQLLKYPQESEEAFSPESDAEVARALGRCQSFLWAADADADFNSYRGTHPNEPGITKRKIKKK